MKKLLLVFNPKAGRGEFPKYLYDVVEMFTREGFEVTAYPTSGIGDAYNFILERGKDFDLITCSGGDGIMNEAANAYIKLKTLPPLSYIPCGTTNDFAVSLGLPVTIPEAAKAILDGRPRQVDAGLFGDKYFTYVAAFGQFTEVPYVTAQSAKNILGRAAYFLEGIKQLGSIHDICCKIDIDGEIIIGNFMLGIITNSTSVGGFKFQPENDSAMDDGLFETIFVRRPKNIQEQSDIIATLTNPEANTEMIVMRSAKKVFIEAEGPCDWTIDGEYGGRHKQITIENVHRALEIIAPS
uniref:Transcription regulator (Contains diacylglycerol kinase catalytic domain) n=1 Tax=uncultured bacterium contig00054 TaxID=1181538 RepID=A0A806KKW7_9BACT|nr:transcription regulator (contains diacylglycerol kinase catalytic domain) [uncultured bacterium contig00054]